MRGDIIIEAELARGFFAVAPGKLEAVLGAVKEGIPRAETIKVSNGNVVYQEHESVAVISIDGGMYKKDMSAMCMSVVAYPKIIEAIEKADSDPKINTTLFRVDTPGGHVDGAEEVAEAIENAKNKTITLFENTGASGGIWVFTASDEVYAIRQTRLGSIGVVATFRNPEEDAKTIEMTSSNAPNKRCKLGEDCQSRMQVMLDSYESMFFERVEKNTGFNKDKIKTTFNDGDMIFANQAKKAGFIQGIMPFRKLLSKLQKDSGVNHSSLQASAQIENKTQTQGEQMSVEIYDEASFRALETSHAEALKSVNTQLNTATTALATMTTDKETAVTALATMQDAIDAKSKAMPEIMSMAFAKGVDQKTLVAMAQADTLDGAKIALVDSVGSEGAFGASEEEDTSTTAKKESWGQIFSKVKES